MPSNRRPCGMSMHSESSRLDEPEFGRERLLHIFPASERNQMHTFMLTSSPTGYKEPIHRGHRVKQSPVNAVWGVLMHARTATCGIVCLWVLEFALTANLVLLGPERTPFLGAPSPYAHDSSQPTGTPTPRHGLFWILDASAEFLLPSPTAFDSRVFQPSLVLITQGTVQRGDQK